MDLLAEDRAIVPGVGETQAAAKALSEGKALAWREEDYDSMTIPVWPIYKMDTLRSQLT